MESAGVLESIAEVAIALAGFGGVAAGLGYRARGAWSPDDRFRLIVLALTGLSVVFGCFLPYATYHLGSTAPWRMASSLYLVVPVSNLLYGAWFLRRGVPAGFSRVASGFVYTCQLGALILLLTAALGLAGDREFGFYLSAILIILLHTAALFIRLLATSFRNNEETA